MASQNDFSFETWNAPATEAFRFWISFFPTAPLFGVEWRYADMMGGFEAPVAPKPAPAKAPAKPKAAAKTAKPDVAAQKPATNGEAPKAKTAPKTAVKAEAVTPEAPAAKASKAETAPAKPAVIEKAPAKAPEAAPVSKTAEPVAEVKATPAKAAPAKAAPAKVEEKPVAAKVAEKQAPAKAAEKPEPAKAVDPSTAPDDLKMIKGVGPGLEKQLNGLGIYQFAQIAKMSEKDLQSVDDRLTSFKGRCFRDDWVGQAKTLLG
ncbi:MAG: hypothetical protein AAFV19_07035 [Pseudomonadota bacterium]